jgi:anti-sigma factor RsiW
MCDLLKEVVALIDGELPAHETRRLEQHLQTCDECSSRAEEYLRAGRTFEAYCDAYYEALTVSKPRFELTHWPPAISAATVMAAVFAVLLLFAPRAHVPRLAVRAPAPPVHASLRAQTPRAEPAMKSECRKATRPPIGLLHLHRSGPALSASRFDRSNEEPQTARSVAQTRSEGANSLFSAPAVQVAIPADALFPPGAVPPGISFTADIAIEPDASAQRISLRPRLAQFERRMTRP